MSPGERHISDADARAIAREIARNDPAQRVEEGKQSMNDALRREAAAVRRRRESRVLGRINQPPPREDGDA